MNLVNRAYRYYAIRPTWLLDYVYWAKKTSIHMNYEEYMYVCVYVCMYLRLMKYSTKWQNLEKEEIIEIRNLMKCKFTIAMCLQPNSFTKATMHANR